MMASIDGADHSANIGVTMVPVSGTVVQLEAWGEDAIRVRIANSTESLVHDPPIQALLPNPPTWWWWSKYTHPTTTHDSHHAIGEINTVRSGNLEASVSSADGLITFKRVSDGRVILRAPSHTFGPVVAASGASTNAGSLTLAREGVDETLYGMGEHRTGSVRLPTPWTKSLSLSHDVEISAGTDNNIPFLMSPSRGWGFVWNLPSYGHINVSSDAITFTSDDAPSQLDFWVCTTPAEPASKDESAIEDAEEDVDAVGASPMTALLHRYVDATGHAAPLPYYATGFIQSKDRYRNASQLMSVAREHVITRGLPMSMIVIDFHHWAYLGDWALNAGGTDCWGADPSTIVDELKDLGVELMVSVWPFVEASSYNFAAMTSQQLVAANDTTGAPLVGNSVDGGEIGQKNAALYDAFQSGAREYVWSQLKAHYVDKGIRSLWIDADEPQMKHLQPGLAHFLVPELGGWVPDQRVGMSWVNHHQQMVHDGMVSAGYDEGDFFMLSRGYWAGGQRYGAGLWSGDVNSTWEELALQVRVAQSTALSGVPYWTTDIGGFKHGDPNDPNFRELVVRWFQFGAFCPLFRLHGHRDGPADPKTECGKTAGPNEVWSFGEPAYEIISGLLELRESLRDYVHAHLRETVATGLPLVRPLALANPDDSRSLSSEVEHEYLFGPDWLVVPVTASGATESHVYLPPCGVGFVWENHYTGVRWDASREGVEVVEPTPLHIFPLYRRVPVG